MLQNSTLILAITQGAIACHARRRCTAAASLPVDLAQPAMRLIYRFPTNINWIRVRPNLSLSLARSPHKCYMTSRITLQRLTHTENGCKTSRGYLRNKSNITFASNKLNTYQPWTNFFQNDGVSRTWSVVVMLAWQAKSYWERISESSSSLTTGFCDAIEWASCFKYSSE